MAAAAVSPERSSRRDRPRGGRSRAGARLCPGLVVALLLQTSAVRAEGLAAWLDWTATAEDAAAVLLAPPEARVARPAGPGRRLLVDLGEIAFAYPGALGPDADRAGLSCATCHAAGTATRRFFVPALSDAPGRADVTHPLFHLPADDGIRNPRPIPSLVGITPPHGTGRHPALESFVRHVVVAETGGTPDPLVIGALSAYVRALRPAAGAAGGAADALERDLARFERGRSAVAALLARGLPARAAWAAGALRRALAAMHDRFSGSGRARAVVLGWSARLRAFRRAAGAGRTAAARQELARLDAGFATGAAALRAALPGSLYHAGPLRAWLAARAAARQSGLSLGRMPFSTATGAPSGGGSKIAR